MNNEANISLELLLTFMLFVIIFSTVISIASTEFDSISETHTRQEAKEQTMRVSNIINEVYFMGNSYSQNYRLPEHINNESYIIQINSSGVYVNSHYQITKDEYIPKNITFNGKKSKNIILTPGDTYTFTNNNGVICIYG
ncbi:MAG: hypothetical protein IJJ11_08410 [Methanosphaera sp.]|nr:hypothetical protein [Methanosphaera sp.]